MGQNTSALLTLEQFEQACHTRLERYIDFGDRVIEFYQEHISEIQMKRPKDQVILNELYDEKVRLSNRLIELMTPQLALMRKLVDFTKYHHVPLEDLDMFELFDKIQDHNIKVRKGIKRHYRLVKHIKLTFCKGHRNTQDCLLCAFYPANQVFPDLLSDSQSRSRNEGSSPYIDISIKFSDLSLSDNE
jgi:hypothetical protein